MSLIERTNTFDCLPQVSDRYRDYLTIPVRGALSDSSDAPIKTILAVGAIHHTQGGLGDHDKPFLQQAILCANEIGLPVSRQVRIAVANLKDNHDYLAPEGPHADLVVLCYIPQEGSTERTDSHGRLISPYGNSPDVWQDRVGKRLPLMVVSVENDHDKGEITAWDIRPPSYEMGPLLPARIHDTEYNSLWRFNAHTIVRHDIAAKLPTPFIAVAQRYQPVTHIL